MANLISGLEDLFKFIFSQMGNALTRDYLLAALGEKHQVGDSSVILV